MIKKLIFKLCNWLIKSIAYSEIEILTLKIVESLHKNSELTESAKMHRMIGILAVLGKFYLITDEQHYRLFIKSASILKYGD